jgi:hypothetical protein
MMNNSDKQSRSVRAQTSNGNSQLLLPHIIKIQIMYKKFNELPEIGLLFTNMNVACNIDFRIFL